MDLIDISIQFCEAVVEVNKNVFFYFESFQQENSYKRRCRS